MLLTKVLQVLLLPAVAVLHSDEYGPRHFSEVAIREMVPHVDLSRHLVYYRSRARDYNARHVLGSVPSWLALAGHWRVTNNDGSYSGGGVVRLWNSGRGEYATRYNVWSVAWYVVGEKFLVLKYEGLNITEFYSLGPPPVGAVLGSLSLGRGRVRLRGLWPYSSED